VSTSQPGDLHTARTLYDDPDWSELRFGRRIAIGRCIRLFADREMLPIRVVNPKATGTKKYQHTASQGAAVDLNVELDERAGLSGSGLCN